MDPQTYMDIATVVTRLKMYPYFDVAHYVLMCMAVRDDVPSPQPNQPSFGKTFAQRHPLSSLVASYLICFAGGTITNFLLGEPLIANLKDHTSIGTFFVIWYLVNFSPFDLTYKLGKFLPIKIILSILKETQRAHKVYHGVLSAAKVYPSAYLIILLIGTLKGAGSGIMKMVDRMVRGLWNPSTNEMLQPSFTTKGCLAAASVFLLERLGYIAAPHALIYFGVVLFFVYFKLSSMLLGISDPFVPLENLLSAVFLGGMLDALRRAAADTSSDKDNEKSKEDKKKD